jgi:hypothetical protein
LNRVSSAHQVRTDDPKDVRNLRALAGIGNEARWKYTHVVKQRSAGFTGGAIDFE